MSLKWMSPHWNADRPPALLSFLYPSGDRSWLRWPSEKKKKIIIILLPPQLTPPSPAALSTIFSKWAENEWAERKRGPELERDGKRIDINSDRAELLRAWRRYLSLSLKVWGRGNGLMVTSRDGEGGGGDVDEGLMPIYCDLWGACRHYPDRVGLRGL